MKNKVSEIEFHCNFLEIDDFILRAAELIKEGYTLTCIDRTHVTIGTYLIEPEPDMHIKLRRKFNEETK